MLGGLGDTPIIFRDYIQFIINNWLQYVMQIRELDLKELYTVYDVLSQLYKDITYDEFEDLIYEMREMNYVMMGIMDGDTLITYAGISILTTFKDKRHLKVFDFVTDKKYDSKKYDEVMREYLSDYAKIGMCESVVYN